MKDDIIKIVQQRLWRNKHRVQRMPSKIGFDLFVDKLVRLRVLPEFISTKFEEFDVQAMVKTDIDGSKRVFFMGKNGIITRNFEEAYKKGGGKSG